MEVGKLAGRLYKVNLKLLSITNYQNLGGQFIENLKNVAITIVCAKAVIQGEMSFGIMMSTQIIIGMLNAPIQQFIQFIISAQFAKISFARINEIHGLEDEEQVGSCNETILPQGKDIVLKSLYFQYAPMQEDKRHYQWGNQFYKLLKENKSPDLKVDFRYFEDEKHLTVTIPATYYGLRYLFEPYEIDINEVTKDPDILVNYSAKIKKELFFDTKPDQSFVNTIGYVALYDRELPDIAISIFELNTKNYPQSINVWDSLAEAYTVRGYMDKAKKCYEKILTLSPTNNTAKMKLEELNSKIRQRN
ncbi:hypothetical protein [Sphingobacterium siyangense]|uniref:ABC transmembrane type-1 domain-containing protein n=1 Tax=Sphingobacterium siyangense TaxID=459529 RepID=A0A562M6L6_9SPHI|nr:hypothetical protein [Sphingobacterium siyangense]TWI15577.1 hypothetical protein IQ31_04979 [Sphingobacterium siyangense]